MNTVTYDDLHIDFTWKEWALLNPSQKNLYKDVMLETYRNLATIGSLLGLKVLVNQLLKWRNYFGLRIILNRGGKCHLHQNISSRALFFQTSIQYQHSTMKDTSARFERKLENRPMFHFKLLELLLERATLQ
ncbi:zinc finger protein 556-like isoform X3 [Arvicola amphibius]|uniref:zinc finger protein 556-like isoform X3 n=1 Tax=Arvicola amphibius TaxID=1047088 RepID=UPI001C098E67|nr:zinc finger protein 556-like isoform X3 [Arvicola amphibius]